MNKQLEYKKGDRVMVSTSHDNSVTTSRFEGRIGEVLGSDIEADDIYYQIKLDCDGRLIKLDFLGKWLKRVIEAKAVTIDDEF